MKQINLLIVEDDNKAIETYKRDISSYNLVNPEHEIIADFHDKKDSALDVLNNSSKSFDAAIIDLDLLGKGGSDASGNEVIREIKGNLRFPVFVITGTPHNVDVDLKSESLFFRIISRDTQENVLEELVKIYKTGITNLLNRKGEIEKYLNNIFWNHISTSIDLWSEDDISSAEEKEKSLLRYTLLHMQEYLDLNQSGNFEKYSPREFYITGPIKPNIFTGDIIEFEDQSLYVVLSPACDIDLKNGVRKSKLILFIKIVHPTTIDSEFTNPLSNNKKGKFKDLISNKIPRYHMIPKINDIKGGFIDFQNKVTIEDETVTQDIENGKIKRIATISSPFLKDVIARYSAYYSRQGSPDFDEEEILNSFISN